MEQGIRGFIPARMKHTPKLPYIVRIKAVRKHKPTGHNGRCSTRKVTPEEMDKLWR